MSWVAQKQIAWAKKKNKEICAKMAKNSNVTASSNRIFPFLIFLRITPLSLATSFHHQHFHIR